MRGYIAGIKRFFNDEWGFDLPLLDEKDKIFGNVDGGLWTTLDNRSRSLHAAGMTRKPYNVLSAEDVEKLFNSPELSGTTPRSFQCRLIFGVAILTAMRPQELSALGVDQIKRTKLEGLDAFIFKGKMGSVDGTCKNARGGLRQISETPKEVPIFNEFSMDGSVNVYQDVDRYLNIRSTIDLPDSLKNRFFLAINGNASTFENFFKRSAVSSGQIRRIIQSAATANGVVGYGDHDHIVLHATRKTSTQRCVDAGLPDTATMKRTGHRCVESVKAYQNLRGETGRVQQASILQAVSTSDSKKQKVVQFANVSTKDGEHVNNDIDDAVKGALQTIGSIHGGTINININLNNK